MRIEQIQIPGKLRQAATQKTGRRPLALVIVDGWGYSPKREGNAIALAHTPNYNAICEKYPSTVLAAAGPRVGLVRDLPGSSEIGHSNIGAGRVVKTDAFRVADSIEKGDFFDKETLVRALESTWARRCDVHLVGLLSDGGVHSSLETLFALLRMIKKSGFREAYVHAILDGHDVPVRTADVYAEAFEIKALEIGIGKIATICGRHYAMDRDENWDRTAKAFSMMVRSEGVWGNDAVAAIRESYLRGIDDEAVAPIVLESRPGVPLAKIKSGDLVICFNHRGDRMRQLIRLLATPVGGAGMPFADIVSLVDCDGGQEVSVVFPKRRHERTLSEVLAINGVSNCRFTESEKLAHVTSYFNGGRGELFPREKIVSIPSGGVMPVEMRPETASFKVTDRFMRDFESGEHEVCIVNLASADLVAHSGNLEKTIEAVQFIDTCLGGILEAVRKVNGIALITSDHGNCEQMFDPMSGQPSGAHTANPVPFHLIDEESRGVGLRVGGALEDVAPTMLGILGLDKPFEMTGLDLRVS